MAITAQGIIGGLQSLAGLSTDAKPTTGVVKGSFFFETDTTRRFEYDGALWALVDTFFGTVQTTNATVTTCGTYTPADGTTVQVTVAIAGRKSDGTQAGGFALTGTFRRAGATTTQVGVPVNLSAQKDDILWNATLDTSGADILVRINGAAGDTVDWRAQGTVVTTP